MHKLLILSRQADAYRALIEQARLPDLTFESTPTPDTDIVFGETGMIREALASLPALTWAQATSAGVESLMDPALRRDYILTNARNVFGRLMSEYVFGYLLAHEKQIFGRLADQQAKRWNHENTGVLYGKTIGLLGVGSIGAELAGAAKFFEMRVWGYTRESETSSYVDKYFHPMESDGLPSVQKRASALQNFASGLDYLVSILPNTQGTRKMVNADLLKSLPAHALFVNVGRGSAVDEAALIEALTRKEIAGAVLDVFEQEPVPQDHPFWTTPNLLMTFHTSAPSLPEDLAKVFIENYRIFLEGRPLKHLVDFERGY